MMDNKKDHKVRNKLKIMIYKLHLKRKSIKFIKEMLN